MLKVLYITTQDKFFLSHLKDRAIYAHQNGFEVAVAAQKTNEIFIQKIEKLGFKFFDTQIERQALNPISQVKAIQRLVHIIEKVQPNISHHLGAKSIIYGTIAHQLAKHPVQSSIVNAPIGLGYVYAAKEIKALLLKPIVRQLYKFTLNPRNSCVIFENPDDLEYFIKIGALKQTCARCIYGAGVDTSVFTPSEDKNEICTVVMASRLIKEKGVFDFIHAAKILKSKSMPVRMLLVGEPDYGNPNSLTKQQFEALKNNGAVECLGYQEDVCSILQTAHICCLPSFYREGLPRFLIEGTSCGLAIVTTNTVGCREAVTNENGFLIQPHSVEELVDSIVELIFNSDLRNKMGKNSRELALKRFASDIICRQTLDVYMSLLLENKSSD